MRSIKKFIAIITTAVSMTICSLGFTPIFADDKTSAQADTRIVGYFPYWRYQYYNSLDFSALTHLNIAFCYPDEQGELDCYIPDSEMKNIVDLAHSHGVKVLAALGGGGGCDSYLPLLDTPEEMTDFNSKIMSYCETYDLDGIDLDIELNSSHEIWKYYGDWVTSLRELCNERGYELTTATAQWVAVNVSPETFGKFDFVNVMAYDNDIDRENHSSLEFAVESLQYFNTKKGIEKDRLVLGVPFYGRGYHSDGSIDWSIDATFASLIEADPDNFDHDSYNGIAYNGAETMRKKCALAKEYGGIMIWEVTQDADGEYSLLEVIKDKMTEQDSIKGDVNADGGFNVADLVLLQKWLLAVPDTVLDDWSAGDLCEDNRLDAFDLCAMRKLLLVQ